MKPTADCPDWCHEDDDENTHMSAVTALPSGWSFEVTQMADEDEPALHLIDPRGLLHAALVPGLSPDDAIRFGAAVLNAGLAAVGQNPVKPADVGGSDEVSAISDANCESGA